MNALFLFSATFALVLFLGLQQMNVQGGHRLLSFATSLLIGVANLVILKIAAGPADAVETGAYLLGGPLGILASMAWHPCLARRFGRRRVTGADF